MKRFGLLLFGVVATAQCGGGDGGGGPPTITAVVISGDSTVVLAGQRQLTAAAFAGNSQVSTGVTFQWTSSNGMVAGVNNTGLVSGVGLGTTAITALAVLNGTPTTVFSPAHGIRTRIGSIAITPGTPQFPSLGESVLVTAEARNALNAAVPGITFTWQSRATPVATATARANTAQADVVAIANGTARVVATGDGVSDSVTATVQQVATALNVTPDTTTFHRIGVTLTPVVSATDARGNAIPNSAIGWLSQNTGAATVNAGTGVITSVNDGQTRVIATSGALADTVRVGVALVYLTADIATSGGLPAPIDSALITRLNGTLQLGLIVRDSGNTIVPNPQGISWSLKTGTIATIGATTGLVTGNTTTGRDTVVLVARTARDSVPLVVRQDLASIAVTPVPPGSPLDLNFVGDTQRFVAVARDAGGSTIPGQTFSWSTNNVVLGIDAAGLASSAAATSQTGVVVRVRASTGGMTDSSVSIGVRQIPNSAVLSPGSLSTLNALGRTVIASCVVKDSGNTTIPSHPCAWTAGTAGVITFTPTTAASTTITAVGNGSTTITATAFTSIFAPNFITVDQVAASVSLLPVNFGTPNVEMTTNQSAPFYAVVRDSTNTIDTRPRTDVAWSIAPGTVASVAAGNTGTNTVSTGAAAGGPETVTATIGLISGTRVLTVVATGVRFGGAGGVQAVFTANCISCHSGGAPPEGLNLSVAGNAYFNIVDIAASEVPTLKRVRPFRPDSSYLVHKIQGTQATVGGSGDRMPAGCSGATCLPNATINLIRNWILQGALNN